LSVSEQRLFAFAQSSVVDCFSTRGDQQVRNGVSGQGRNSVSVRVALAGSTERHAERVKQEGVTGAVPALEGQITPQAMADALAIFAADLVGVMPQGEHTEMLQRLANRLDDQARVPGAGQAAAMLGAISGSLMRMGM
jgi:hypothetical protein